MGIPIIGELFKSVAGLGQTYIEGKNAVSKAKADAKAAVIVKSVEKEADWEKIMAENSGNSWKDEWLTLLFSIPLILAFIPSMVPYVHEGFKVLEIMPDWYQYTLSVIVAASFGVRSAIGFMKAKK